MKHRSEPHTFLNAEKPRFKAALETTAPGSQRDLANPRLRQIEAAFHIDGWVSSAGPLSPKLTRG